METVCSRKYYNAHPHFGNYWFSVSLYQCILDCMVTCFPLHSVVVENYGKVWSRPT